MTLPKLNVGGVMLLGRIWPAGGASCCKSSTPPRVPVSPSAELQVVADVQMFDSILGMDFPVTVADPARPDCPLIACSHGFSSMTGYEPKEVVGKNSSFLTQGVPDELLDKETCCRAHAFCLAAAEGYGEQQPGNVPEVLKFENPSLTLGKGEELYVQTSAKKTGELFLSLFFLKTVDLDDRPFIISLQASLGEAFVEARAESTGLRKVASDAFANLSSNMDTIEMMLASRFQYSSAMRRKY